MLKRLHLQNFTVFADADFEFSPGLNVLVGTNGTGKSQLLKLGYTALNTAARFKVISDFKLIWDASNILGGFHGNTKRNFLPSYNDVRRLIRWGAVPEEALIECTFGEKVSFWFEVI